MMNLTMYRIVFALAVLTVIFITAPELATAQTAPGKLTSQNAKIFGQLLDRQWKNKPEWALMLTDILSGKPMKSNSGWFKPSEKRLGWDWLAENFDKNDDAIVSESEAQDFAKVFTAIDQNGDGTITRVDFNWDNVSHVGPSKSSEALFFLLDRNSNGRVDQREILQWMAVQDEGKKGYLTPDEFSKGLSILDEKRTNPGKKSAGHEDPTQMMNMLLKGDLGTLTEGPKLGELAPDFELPLLQGNGTVKLSNLRGNKIVVLNFGSFT